MQDQEGTHMFAGDEDTSAPQAIKFRLCMIPLQKPPALKTGLLFPFRFTSFQSHLI
jgi:hypothetical protein